HTVGMWLERDKIVAALLQIPENRVTAIYNKSAKTLPFKANIEASDGYLFGENMAEEVMEYGCRFKVDWVGGQKTGFFIDQRENRKLLAQYASGRSVLNMFCYTGGFSFAAMQGGAIQVHSVDASAKAIEWTNENVALNFPGDTRHEAFVADAFDFMNDIRNKYDLIILDPPAFAKHRNALSQALQGYKRLNAKAFQQTRPGGRSHSRTGGAHPAPAFPTSRPPCQHLPSRGRIPERTGFVRSITYFTLFQDLEFFRI
ncbi:MAG: class I SAM-dependent methyltransferase, partial [Marinilabiliales bacterium]|nr:class I SAM-dependent methyltransferase [Marinilabiliales bacterium]